MNSYSCKTFQMCQLLCCNKDKFTFGSRYNIEYLTTRHKNAKQNGDNWYLKKHNHDKKSTCCSPKTALRGNLVENPDLDIGKMLKN